MADEKIPANSLALVDGASDDTPVVVTAAGALRRVPNQFSVLSSAAGAALVGWQGTGTGRVPRTLAAKLAEWVSVKEFGAKGDGTTDDTAAIQTGITQARAEGFDLLFPDGNYKVTGNLTDTGTVVMGALCKYGRVTITKTGTGDLFSGASAVITNLNFVHQGASGRILNLTGDGARAEGCSFINAAGNASSMVRMTRSDHFLGRCYFTNNEPSAYCVHVERTSAGMCINGAISNRNTFAGVGKGVRFSSSAAGFRPEGWEFAGNVVILTGQRHLLVEAMLHLAISRNVLDQCSGVSIDLAPGAENIDSVTIDGGNYIATAAAATTGIGVETASGTGGIFNLKVLGNHFEHCGYGISLNPKVNEFSVLGNTYANIAVESVRYNGALRGVIGGNMFRGANVHLSLTDGTTGQAISVVDNVFPSTGSVSGTLTDRTRFQFSGNVGKRFSGYASATVAATSGTSVAVTVPHGLAFAPSIDKVVGSVQQVTGTHDSTSIKVVSVDATNVTLGVYYVIGTAGNLRVNLFCSV